MTNSTKTILAKVTEGFIYLTLFSPLAVASSLFFPFITGKALFFRLAVTLAFGSALILALIDRDYRPRRSWLVWVLAGLLTVATLATIFGVSPMNSFWSNYERMEGLVSYFYLAGYFFALISIFNTEKLWRRLIQTSVGVSVLIGLYGVGQLLGWFAINQGGVRVDATFGNAAYLAIYMVFNFGFLVWLWLGEDKKTTLLNAGYALVGLLQLMILYYTATRGAILGLVAGLLVGALAMTIFGRRKSRMISGIMIAVVLLAGLGFWLVKDVEAIRQSPVLGRFASISLSDTTTESRLTIWQMSYQGAVERPVLGYGPENFGMVFNKYYEPKLWRSEPWFDRAHNVVMDWLVNTGFVGLVIYLAIFAVIKLAIWKNRKEFGLERSAVLLGIMTAYFVHNLFVFDNLVSYQMFLIFAGLIYFYSSRDSKPLWSGEIEKRLQSIIVFLVAMVMVVSAWFSVVVPYSGASNLLQALVFVSRDSEAPPVGFVDEVIGRFEKALQSPLGRKQAREYLFSQSIAVAQSPSISDEDKDKILKFAYQEGKNQLADEPDDVRFLLLFGGFLTSVGMFDEAIEYLEYAKTLAPRKQQVLIELARAYFTKNDSTHIALGLAELKYALELDPEYDQARRIYGSALNHVGRTVEANAILAPLGE